MEDIDFDNNHGLAGVRVNRFLFLYGALLGIDKGQRVHSEGTMDFHLFDLPPTEETFERPEFKDTNKTAYELVPIESQSHIRLVYLEPSREEDSEIVCDLKVVDTQDPLDFEALSYTWGPSLRKKTITLQENTRFDVTDNLAAALRRLRYIDKLRTLWVDALCINQQNNPERDAQVLLMSAIYGKAARVLVWLGDCNEQAPRSIASGGEERFKKPLIKAAETSWRQESLKSAIEHTVPSWGERMWTIQEVHCGKGLPTVHFGPIEVSWTEFMALLSSIFDNDFLKRKKAMAYPIPGGYPGDIRSANTYELKIAKLWLRTLILQDLSKRFHDKKCSLLQLAPLNERVAVTDPRDRIYSLLSMMEPDEAQRNTPKYEPGNTTQHVFARATYNLMEVNQSLEVLTLVSSSTSCLPDLPTWAVDFGTRKISWFHQQYSLKLTSSDWHDMPFCKPTLSEDARLLTVHGTVFDYVLKTFRLGKSQRSPLFDALGSTWRAEVGHRGNGDQFWLSSDTHKRPFVWEWRPFYLRPMSRVAELNKGEPGRSKDPQSRKAMDHVLDTIFISWLYFSAGLDMPHEEYVKAISNNGAVWWNHLRRGYVRSELHEGVHPCFFITRGGRVGVGPATVQARDTIAVLPASQAYSLLRQRKGCTSYTFQGHVYVNKDAQFGNAADWEDDAKMAEERDFILS